MGNSIFTMTTIFSVCLLVIYIISNVLGQELSAFTRISMSPDDMNSLEHPTNLTIDQIITKAMGGLDVAVQKMVGPNGMILAELDMNLTEEQFRSIYQPPEFGDNSKKLPYFEPRRKRRRKKRKAVRRIDLRWPFAEMPYTFAEGHFSEKEKYVIKVAMREWEKYTCMRFRPANRADINYVRFQNGRGCNSQLGMVGGMQVLNLDANGCRWKGLYLHEIGHAIGLVHEHQLPNRDQFIDIIYENVESSMRIWFDKYSRQEVNQFDVPYEYSSVMHYGITAFSKDGKSQTIRARDQSKEETIGKVWRKELSFTDVKAVNRMYECDIKCPKNIRCSDGGFVDENCKCMCPDGTSDCQLTRSRTSDEETTTQPPTCVNDYDNWKCNVWATQGECELNPRFMHQYCRRSCNACGGSSSSSIDANHVATWAWQWLGLFANLFPQEWTIDECQDIFHEDKCRSWAQNGDCITNEKWMEENCRKTCGACSRNGTDLGDANCRNSHENNTECDTWARKGECQINARWMAKNCQKACRVCERPIADDPVDTPRDRSRDRTDIGREEEVEDRDLPRNKDDDDNDDGGGFCQDEHNSRECQRWAREKECQVNPSWMIPNCRKSCGRCNDGSCKNLHDDKKCHLWAKDGECIKNSNWMLKNCAKSCNSCEMLEDRHRDRNRDEERNKDRNDDIPRNDDDDDDRDDDRKTGNRNCRNDHDDYDCDTWAANGHCDINPGYMKVNCKRSCAVCDSQSANDDNDEDEREDDSIVGRVPDIENDNGVNQDGTTKASVEESGSTPVTIKPIVTSTYTPTTTMSATPKACIDEHSSCPVWARSGYCRQNAAYALKACRLSCDNCKQVCRDDHLFCPAWSSGDQCRKNASYMLRFCQKSCNVCT